MQLVNRSAMGRIKGLAEKISRDNLFLLSSSISYYSALALAPFALILLSVASILGRGMQNDIVKQTALTVSPQVGQMVDMVFQNVNKGVDIGSISGIIGAIVLLSTASMVFLQFRYSFDVIYGDYNPKTSKTIWESVREKLFSMFFVVMAAIVFLASIFGSSILLEIFGGNGRGPWSTFLVLYLNFMVYLGMFTAIHHFVPSKRFPITDTLKKAGFSAVFFMIGNMLMATYLRGVAASSVYGAAGTILVFLTWAYYSSFIVFLSVVVFQYLKKIGKVS